MGPRTAHGSKKLGRGRGARSLFRPSALALTLAIAAVFCTTLLLPSATDLGGAVTIKSGSGAATSSGSLGLLTSDTGATGVSGQVTLSSGTASSGASGAVGIESGSSASGSRGAISLSVGSGNGAGGTLSADDRGVKNTASFHSFLRSAAQVAQSTGQTAFKASSEKAIAPCSDLDSLTTGSWNDATQSWAPSLCLHNEAVSSQFPSCLNNKTIGFYGDSTLRNIVNEMLKLGKVDGEIKLKTWGQAPDYTLGGGKMPGDSSRGEIKMYWTPSAYHQQPAQIPSRLDRDDVAVVSIGPWDMGTYYKGVTTWYLKMNSLLAAAVQKRGGKPLFVMNIHNLYPHKCEGDDVRICQQCNTNEATLAFREALQSAVQCVRSKGYTNLHLIDPFGITNNTFAMERSDGVHYDNLVTRMEMELLLAAVCLDLRLSTLNGTCPENPDFETGRDLKCKK